MKKTDLPLQCHISTQRNSMIDPVLDKEGFSRGLLSFAIPSLGILFKCRADGNTLDLEFAAFFALLKFIKRSLKSTKVRKVQIHSSKPEFVFAFTGQTPHLKQGSSHRKLLSEYSRKLQISVGFVEPYRNQSFVPPQEFPCLPDGVRPALKPDPADLERSEFRPFQRGIKL